jgi:PIN domain nuclease of toxin-antitoxin system
VKLLLDTHAVIWFFLDHPRLSTGARYALEDAEILYVSVASAWEYETKRRKRPQEFHASFAEMCDAMPSTGLDLEFDLHVFAQTLPLVHSDPFDRMLIAQALRHDLTLVTCDSAIRQYAVPTIW